jgi:hypothetical protein
MVSRLPQLLVIVALAGLSACGTASSTEAADSGEDAAGGAPSSAVSVDASNLASIEKAAGLPPKPTGRARLELLNALAEIDPQIVDDEDKAISAARNQCQSINGDGKNLAESATARFSYRGNEITQAQGQKIVDMLMKSGFCKV